MDTALNEVVALLDGQVSVSTVAVEKSETDGAAVARGVAVRLHQGAEVVQEVEDRAVLLVPAAQQQLHLVRLAAPVNDIGRCDEGLLR